MHVSRSLAIFLARNRKAHIFQRSRSQTKAELFSACWYVMGPEGYICSGGSGGGGALVRGWHSIHQQMNQQGKFTGQRHTSKGSAFGEAGDCFLQRKGRAGTWKCRGRCTPKVLLSRLKRLGLQFVHIPLLNNLWNKGACQHQSRHVRLWGQLCWQVPTFATR